MNLLFTYFVVSNEMRAKASSKQTISGHERIRGYKMLAPFLLLSLVTSAPQIIKYDAARGVEAVAVLGRGYDPNTDSFLSTCMDTSNNNGTSTQQSYNYECKNMPPFH